MDENYRCDYVEPGSRVECGNDMSFVPSVRAPGEFVYCEKDGNLKHIIRVPTEWNDILGKPEDFENAIYTILSWILDSSEYGELRTEDDVSRVKQYLNDVILRNCNIDFVADDNLVATLISRYLESKNGEDARTRREDRATINDILSERRIEFDDDSTIAGLLSVVDDNTVLDLYGGIDAFKQKFKSVESLVAALKAKGYNVSGATTFEELKAAIGIESLNSVEDILRLVQQ